VFGACDEVSGGLESVWYEEFHDAAKVGKGIGVVEDFLLDFVGDFILPLALPLLEIVGHNRIKFFAPDAGLR